MWPYQPNIAPAVIRQLLTESSNDLLISLWLFSPTKLVFFYPIRSLGKRIHLEISKTTKTHTVYLMKMVESICGDGFVCKWGRPSEKCAQSLLFRPQLQTGNRAKKTLTFMEAFSFSHQVGGNVSPNRPSTWNTVNLFIKQLICNRQHTSKSVTFIV